MEFKLEMYYVKGIECSQCSIYLSQQTFVHLLCEGSKMQEAVSVITLKCIYMVKYDNCYSESMVKIQLEIRKGRDYNQGVWTKTRKIVPQDKR